MPDTAQAIAAIIARTPAGSHVAVEIDGAPSLKAAIEREDANDILGNLIDNAVRHAQSRVRVTIRPSGKDICVEIADDGPGADSADMELLSRRGMRQDEKGGSAGLGLAITGDILAAYGRKLDFAGGPDGGLSVRFTLPLA